MASVSRTLTVPAPTSVAAGAGVSTAGMGSKTLTLEAVGTATYQAQISCALSGGDGGAVPAGGDTSWVPYGSALTASGQIEITAPVNWVRWNCTSYASGTPTSRLIAVMNLARGG